MIVNDVHITNLNILYDIAKLTHGENNFNKVSFKLSKVLNEVIITLNLSNIKTIEAMYIKKISENFLIKLDKLDIDNVIYENREDIDLVNNIELCYNVIKKMKEQKNIVYDRLFYPNIVDNFTATITISGSKILQFFGFDFHKIFIDKENNNEFINIYDENIIEKHEELIKNNIIIMFLTYLYKFIDTDITDYNLLADSYIDNKYYSKVGSNDLAVLSSITGGYDLNISFFNTDKERLVEQIKSFRSKINNPLGSESTKINFVLNTSFLTFIMLYLHTDNIIDYQHFNVVLSSKNFYVPIDGLSYFKNRITNVVESNRVLRDYMASSSDNNINKYLYIPYNSKIKYILSVDLIESDKFIKKMYNLINYIKEYIYIDDIKPVDLPGELKNTDVSRFNNSIDIKEIYKVYDIIKNIITNTINKF